MYERFGDPSPLFVIIKELAAENGGKLPTSNKVLEVFRKRGGIPTRFNLRNVDEELYGRVGVYFMSDFNNPKIGQVYSSQARVIWTGLFTFDVEFLNMSSLYPNSYLLYHF